jgi:signal transduction histidine kinase/ligand-binding sensor domain-containing protein
MTPLTSRSRPGRIRSRCLLLLCFASISEWAAGANALLPQASSYGVDFWREAEGLPQSRVRAIAQTRDGYLWLGTDGGVVRFNGAGFTAFTVETGSLKDNEVWALQEDDEGALWIGTYAGGITRLKDGRFKTFTTADGLPDDVVTHIAKDSAGDLWISTLSGVCRYSRGTFTRLAAADAFAGGNFGAICAHSSNQVFAATASSVLRFVGGHFEPLPGIVEDRDGAIEQLTCAGDGSLWIGFRNAVIKRWNKGNLTTYRSKHNQTPQITMLFEDPSRNIWAAFGQRLHKLRDGRFEPVLIEEDKTDLGIVYSLHVDREGSIWAGLQSNGLARLRVKELSTISTREGLPNDSARSVFQDHQGAVWIGTASGIGRLKDGHVVSYTEHDGRRLGPIRSFAEDSQDRLWVASGKDLLLLKNGRLSRFPGWETRSEIEVIYRDAGGRMWVGTDGDGLYRFRGPTFENYRDRDGLPGNRIRALFNDRQGALWISAFGGGVSRYADGQFTNFNASAGLAGNRVSAIHEDERGTLWFATRGGLTRLKDGKFFSYRSSSGLLVDFVYSILDDDRGNFWFNCAQGLFKVSKQELSDFAEGRIRKITSLSYGVRDGMKTRAGNVGNQPAAWKTNDGTLLFSSMKGVVVVVPGRLQSSHFIPPVHIESVTVNKQKQQLNWEPRLPQGAGEVAIDYAALSYLDPEKVRFKYRLEGFDTDWVDAGARRFAYYANLPPGSFRFHVIAGNVDGSWNEQGAAFGFYLTPHFYQTRPFLAVVGAGAVLLGWLLYRLRMHELKARYSAVLAERNRISQDIHDTFAQNLTGIALHLDSMTMQLDDVPDGLRESIDEACNLTRYSLAEARRALTDLRSDELERSELHTVLPELTRRLVGSAVVRTSIQVLGTPHRLNPVTEKNLLRIFQEAVANALKHAQPHVIDIELKYEPEGLALRVRDDGRGFDAERAGPLQVGHYGLTGMRERAERIGGILTLRSAPGQGTELLVTVPFPA